MKLLVRLFRQIFNMEVDESIVEDASWLRKESGHLHINAAKLEAVGCGVNMAIAWDFETFMLAVDSLAVVSWMTSVIDKRNHFRTKGTAEMLVKCHLGVISDIIIDYGLDVTVHSVPSVENRADHLTSLPKTWLEYRVTGEGAASVAAAIATGESPEDAIWAEHSPHHLGLDRTLYLTRQIDSSLSCQKLKQELAGCEVC